MLAHSSAAVDLHLFRQPSRSPPAWPPRLFLNAILYSEQLTLDAAALVVVFVVAGEKTDQVYNKGWRAPVALLLLVSLSLND